MGNYILNANSDWKYVNHSSLDNRTMKKVLELKIYTVEYLIERLYEHNCLYEWCTY